MGRLYRESMERAAHRAGTLKRLAGRHGRVELGKPSEEASAKALIRKLRRAGTLGMVVAAGVISAPSLSLCRTLIH